MIGFLIGLLFGGLCGVMTMALFQIGRNESDDVKETEVKDIERDHTDD